MQEITKKCSKCIDGVERISSLVDGETVHEEITCRTCSGSGLRSSLSLSDSLITLLGDINDKINDIKEKADEIKEVVDELQPCTSLNSDREGCDLKRS